MASKNYWHVIKIIKKSNILVSVALTEDPCFRPEMLIFTGTRCRIDELLNIEYEQNTCNVQVQRDAHSCETDGIPEANFCKLGGGGRMSESQDLLSHVSQYFSDYLQEKIKWK
jgi:hypothetical protein